MTSIIFMGTPDFSAPILRMLHDEGYDIKAVVTQPDRPVGRKRVLTPPPVKAAALELGLPIIQPEKLRGSEELQQILALQPDLVITAAFGQILPKELLDAPAFGCINVHASLLPKYRGGAPIHQAIIDGEKETGVTIMYMAEKLDAGDIISQRAIPIEENDYTGGLFEKLSIVGCELLKETLPSIINGTNSRTVQDEALVTFASNISREQERIDWTNDAATLYNQVRGLHPWPVAYTTFEDGNFKVWWAAIGKCKHETNPGTVVAIEKDHFEVAAGNGTTLALYDVQPAGKKRMTAEEYLRGTGSKLQIGDQFK
ncbi:MAG TPA: methionyl-tRNA formyltransferase [Lysinibacillus sp.]|jgi:methionyl-tRNA formyltransferase|uniref:Methionyl-tRNA formyltransferase n=1 Tax=Lysinibacillus fusiformis TaxID=28031 RepID=A0A2I0V4V7_9BACI|nr:MULTISPECIES: methionyl-tRNA formyltransferase [Lysinibacillus]HBT71125.1 methionyl-tRNA formyltransferase [Lysinibacillus sp.]KUF36412.1 methionyl-tRNA formyltransferase [Lysinibacillus sp. F5]MEE3806958.1 methionyl-tRNA formyltransferase [Lysinibacillus fusiformis]PKU53325.1 methionyl-tRNA formyltransferase [Lysinibacillus fusiformis]WCH48718.1 methionyl-tRNA formyltransferase [Lysinibacillus sp. OF-1]